MPDRRTRSRYVLTVPVEGTLRTFREVAVRRERDGTLIATVDTPVAVDELLTLALAGPVRAVMLTARVTGVRPIVVAGALRHELRLALVDEPVVDDVCRPAEPTGSTTR